ncbi:hypothetical protein [Azospirillum soli]|uniref:hypothetical protein n=1 Tax=Azospirillum soli TaxID=1304799 RepID=UPI001AE6E9AC|nr:hypothetical protein [Azospirillum soli]
MARIYDPEREVALFGGDLGRLIAHNDQVILRGRRIRALRRGMAQAVTAGCVTPADGADDGPLIPF